MKSGKAKVGRMVGTKFIGWWPKPSSATAIGQQRNRASRWAERCACQTKTEIALDVRQTSLSEAVEFEGAEIEAAFAVDDDLGERFADGGGVLESVAGAR